MAGRYTGPNGRYAAPTTFATKTDAARWLTAGRVVAEPKAANRRMVYLPEPAIEALRDHLAARRHNSRLHRIGVGRRHAGTNILVLAHDLDICVLTTDGELIRELVLDPNRDYQPQPKPGTMSQDTCARCPETSHSAEGVGFEPTRTLPRPSGFQDHRTRPLCEPSRTLNLPYLLA